MSAVGTVPRTPPATDGPATDGPATGRAARPPLGVGDRCWPEPSGPSRARPPHRRRTWAGRRRGLLVLAAVTVVVAAAAGTFAYRWDHSGPRPLSPSVAIERFLAQGGARRADPGTLRPPSGVYLYAGTGHEHISLPPRSQSEGPGMPGTVSSAPGGCWVWRVDYSNSHWQSATFCPRGGNLTEVGRAGWYRWSFVALSMADTATFRCTPEVARPAVLHVGQSFPFTCTGTNDPLHTAPVSVYGVNRFLGLAVVDIARQPVVTMHFRETTRYSGGQTGTNVADTWLAADDALPVMVSWTTTVTTPTFLGSSTLTGHATLRLRSLQPRS